MSFFAELKRRNVFKVGVAYAIVAWLLIQIVSIVVPAYQAPAWVMPIFITLICIGFPIALILAWAFELTPEGIKVTATEGPAQFHTRTTGQRLNYFIIGVLVLTVTFLAVDNYVLKEPPAAGNETPGTSIISETVSPAKSVEAKAKPAAPPNSIAVLPFTNLSEDKANEYFADGLAEELLNKLARVKGLQVTGRTSSFYFKGKNEDLRIIGETLGVANILEGSVRKSGDQIRITAQLINASDGYHLWSESYDRNLKDIFEVQDEIALAVTTALSITLGAGEFSLPGSTRNVDAYDEGLKAAALWKFFTQESVTEALAHMERAVSLDKEWAQGWYRLSDYYGVARALFPPSQTQAFTDKHLAALDRARLLAPDLPALLEADANGHLAAGDLLAAERVIKQLSEAGGSDNRSGYLEMRFLAMTGRVREASARTDRGALMNPLESGVFVWKGIMETIQGKHQQALAAVESGLKLGGWEDFLKTIPIYVALDQGDVKKAATLLLESGSHAEWPRYILENNNAAALSAIRERLKSKSFIPIELNTIWNFAVVLGDMDLVYGMRFGNSGITEFMWADFARPMRQSPEFKDYLKEIGIVDYWRASGNWGDYCRPVDDDDFECQ